MPAEKRNGRGRAAAAGARSLQSEGRRLPAVPLRKIEGSVHSPESESDFLFAFRKGRKRTEKNGAAGLLPVTPSRKGLSPTRRRGLFALDFLFARDSFAGLVADRAARLAGGLTGASAFAAARDLSFGGFRYRLDHKTASFKFPNGFWYYYNTRAHKLQAVCGAIRHFFPPENGKGEELPSLPVLWISYSLSFLFPEIPKAARPRPAEGQSALSVPSRAGKLVPVFQNVPRLAGKRPANGVQRGKANRADLPRLDFVRLTLAMPTFSANSFKDIFLSAITRSSRKMIIENLVCISRRRPRRPRPLRASRPIPAAALRRIGKCMPSAKGSGK